MVRLIARPCKPSATLHDDEPVGQERGQADHLTFLDVLLSRVRTAAR